MSSSARLLLTACSGTIELNEFVEAMSQWMGESMEEEEVDDTMMIADQVGKKRRRTDDEEREHVHKQIKSFFSQIKPEALGEELQKEGTQRAMYAWKYVMGTNAAQWRRTIA